MNDILNIKSVLDEVPLNRQLWDALPACSSTIREVYADDGTEVERSLFGVVVAEWPFTKAYPDGGPDRGRVFERCRFLVMLVKSEHPDADSFRRFAVVIDKLLEQKLVTAWLCPPTVVPLTPICGGEESGCRRHLVLRDGAPQLAEGEFLGGATNLATPIHTSACPQAPQCALICYMHSRLSNEELNAALGFAAFLEEGVLAAGGEEWPNV